MERFTQNCFPIVIASLLFFIIPIGILKVNGVLLLWKKAGTIPLCDLNDLLPGNSLDPGNGIRHIRKIAETVPLSR